MARTWLTALLLLAGLTGDPASKRTERAAGLTPEPVRAAVFIENAGQWEIDDRFVARFPGMLVRAGKGEMLWQLFADGSDGSRGELVRVRFEGARSEAAPEGEEPLEGRFHFFRGSDPSRWVTRVQSFGQVRYRELYEGIDLVLREEDGRPKYDLVVATGADLSCVRLRCEGIRALRPGVDGALLLELSSGTLMQPAPRSWQELASGERREVTCAYRVEGESGYGFDCADRDASLPLVIDPGLVWSTYLGGVPYLGGSGSDLCSGLARGRDGDITAVGIGAWFQFPITSGAYQHPGGNASSDAFVTRLRGGDGALVWSCVIGGHDTDNAFAVAVDAQGEATVAGRTVSSDFPTTPGAFDTQKNSIGDTAFVLRLSADGSQLRYSTFLEGTAAFGNSCAAYAVAVADSGAAVVAGQAAGSDFPTTPGSFDPTHNGGGDVFVTRLDPTGSTLKWSTFLGGLSSEAALDLAMDAQENITLTGYTGWSDFPTTPGAYSTTFSGPNDAFVTRLQADGAALIWSTFLGGQREDAGARLALGPDGEVLVGGGTYSLDFPTTPGAFQRDFHVPAQLNWLDGFATRLNSSGSALIFSTYLGTQGNDSVQGVALDSSGIATVLGTTESAVPFPTTPGSYSPQSAGDIEMFLLRLDPVGNRLFYSTFLGSPYGDFGGDLAMNAIGRVTVGGTSNGPGYPTTTGVPGPTFFGGGSDAVVTTMDLLLQGVAEHGTSTPSCLGPLLMNVTEMPAAGASSFSFYCSGAPPLARGFMVIGRTPASSAIPIGGAGLWVEPSSVLLRLPATTDGYGYAENHFPLSSSAAGLSFAAQYVFRNTSACPASGNLSASNALVISVQ